MLEVFNINSFYDSKQILFDVSFAVGQGEIVLLIGSNGSGKSTLFKSIYRLGMNGLSTRGEIRYNDEDISVECTSHMSKQGICYVPQNNNYYDNLSVLENLQIGSNAPAKTRRIDQRTEEILDTFPQLRQHLKALPVTLSGGQRQMLALASALQNKPLLIMLDEPFNGLSEKNMDAVRDILIGHARSNNTTIMLVEHRIKYCTGFVDRLFALKLGHLDEIKKVDGVFSEARITNTLI